MAMVNDNDKVIDILNNLVQTCKDGEEGFRAASENVLKADLKRLFKANANEREQFGTELQALVRSLGGSPEKGGTVSAAFHRGWMTIKTTFSGRSDRAIVADCVRGEDYAVKAYREAVEKELPANVRSLVERQYEHTKKTHDHIRDLEIRMREKTTWKEKPQPHTGERRSKRREIEDHSHMETGF